MFKRTFGEAMAFGFSTLYRVVGGETRPKPKAMTPPWRVSVLSIESLGVKQPSVWSPPRMLTVSVLSIESLGVKPLPGAGDSEPHGVSVLSIESLGVKPSCAWREGAWLVSFSTLYRVVGGETPYASSVTCTSL